ncbi:MAG: pilus assembly protein N-terminal domain-containing protein [Acidobacteriota bacterium]
MRPPLRPRRAPKNCGLPPGKSIVIDYPEDIRQISTTDPAIVDATAITTREILLNAKGLGTATMIVWSSSNQRMFYNVTVDLNTESLKRILRETFPNEKIEVRNSGDSISLNGVVSTKEVADRAAALSAVAARVVVNNLGLTAEKISQQVLLHVKFIELDRSKLQDYGINFSTNNFGTGSAANPAFNFLGSLMTGSVSGPTLAGRFTTLGLDAQLKALQTRNILQVLSEPTLVTTDGKEGTFLVGGEVPVPVIQGGNNTNSVTIMYREFGVRLRYTPQVTANKTIKLNLFQEVSALDYTNATTLSGFVIPAISTRRAETSVELGEGETFAVAGLLDRKEREVFTSIPGISSIPILGNLFKNKSERKDNTELIMLVTPEITMPLAASDPKPDIPFPNEFMSKMTAEEADKTRKAK